MSGSRKAEEAQGRVPDRLAPAREEALRRFYGATLCRQRAEQALAGLGDPTLGEWREWSGYAYHLRRRLTAAEQAPIGPPVDIRGTPEALRRIEAIPKHLRTYIPADVLAEEIGER